MNILTNVDQNIYYSILLIIVMIITTKKLPHKNKVVKTLNIISIMTIIATIGEGLTENGILSTSRLSVLEQNIYHFSSTLTACLAILLCASWMYFVYLYINRYKDVKEKVLKIIMLPLFFVIPIIASSPFTGLMVDLQFSDKGMVYGRGPLYFVVVVIEMSYILACVIYAIKSRKELSKTEFVLLLALEVMPTLGLVAQMLNAHLLYIFPGAMFTIVLSYLLLKEKISDRNDITLAKTPTAFSVMLKTKNPHDYIVAYIKLGDYVDIRKRLGKTGQISYLKQFSKTVLENLEPGIDLIYMNDCKFVLYFNNNNTNAAEKFIYKIREELLKLKNDKYNYKFDFNLTSVSKENYGNADLLKTAYIEFYDKNKEVHS